MVAARQNPCVTRQEYLEWESKQETKHEYHNGVIVAIASATWQHNLISFNVGRNLGNQLEEEPCSVVTSDMRVLVPDCDKYYYPDVVVVCGEPQFDNDEFVTLLNPILIVEVLSASTERADRREKRDCYHTLPSLQTYVLIAQDRPRVEVLMPQADGEWRMEVANSLDATMELPSIGCRLRLADIYARVPFLTLSQNDVSQSAASQNGNSASPDL